MLCPILIIGIGNPSRGDDALGPTLIERLEERFGGGNLGVELLTDFQLQVEYALDLRGRELVLFVDATVACESGVCFAQLTAATERGYSSHALSPEGVLAIYRKLEGREPPASFGLMIPGESFELGAPLSPLARAGLELAQEFLLARLEQPQVAAWQAELGPLPGGLAHLRAMNGRL